MFSFILKEAVIILFLNNKEYLNFLCTFNKMLQFQQLSKNNIDLPREIYKSLVDYGLNK